MKLSLTVMDFVVIAVVIIAVAVGAHFLLSYKDAAGNKLSPGLNVGGSSANKKIADTPNE